MNPITTHGKLLEAIFTGEINKNSILKKLQQAGFEAKKLASEDLLEAMTVTDVYMRSDQACYDRNKKISEQEYFEILAHGLSIIT